MADTTYVDKSAPPIYAAWLNDVNNVVYRVLGKNGSVPVDAAALRLNVGAAASGANNDITSLAGLTTALSVAQGGTGATTGPAGLVNLGGDTRYAKLTGATFIGAVIFQTTDGVTLPAGTTAQRPTVPNTAEIRFNTDLSRFEGYSGTAWGSMGGATGGGSDDVFYENSTTVTADYTITAGKNAMSAGPITINTGVTVTVPTGSQWTVV